VRQRGRNFALVVVAEAVKDTLGQQVRQRAGTVGQTYGGIGHLLGGDHADHRRGNPRYRSRPCPARGQPNWSDRLSPRLRRPCRRPRGEGRFDRMVAWQNRQVVDVELSEAIARPEDVDPNGTLIRTARSLNILFRR